MREVGLYIVENPAIQLAIGKSRTTDGYIDYGCRFSSVPVVVLRSLNQAEQKKRQLYAEVFRSAL